MTAERWRDLIALGHAARRGGRMEEALAHYRSALLLAPASAEANAVYGLMLLQLNRIDEAAAPLQRAVDADPSDWRIRDRLGDVKAMAGHFSEAAGHYREAAARNPHDASLLYKRARATFDSGSVAEAKAILDDAARLAPGHEAILHLYAEIYERSSAWDDLERTAQSWLGIQASNPLPWRYAATAQWETGYLATAMQSYRRFLDLGGRNATNLATYGRLCLAAHAYDEGSRALDEAAALDPDDGHLLSARATLAMFRGRFADALAFARRAIGVDRRDMSAFKVLVQVTGARIADDEREQLKRLSEDAQIRLQDRISASFALGDCFDAQGDIEKAFAAYEHANRLSVERARQERVAYDRNERARHVDWLMSTFRAAPAAAPAGAFPVPIFIVGMPRSGTTLVESILAAHSKVFACGERQEMRSIMQEFVSSAVATGIPVVPESTKQRWRETFWRELPDLGGAIAVTDKNPWNFDALGLILDLFPNARIVHVRRDPVETGLSIYRNEFPKFASFANRLEDIGHYYGEYARLMARWEDVLGDRFLTIQYERLVGDFAAAAPELLRFCGLAWEEACGNFYAADRVIGTMSAVQARQPLAAFKGRRERYARYIVPLESALREAGIDLKTGALARAPSS